jgi:hypothetical protein
MKFGRELERSRNGVRRDIMKTVLVSIALCFAATSAHSMPVSILNTDELSTTIPIADQCGDRCGSFRSYVKDRRAVVAGYSGGYVLVPDPLIQRRPFCPFGSYVACVASGAFCTDLCY